MRGLPEETRDWRGLAWNKSPSAAPELLATSGGTTAAAAPLFQPCRRATARDLFAFCRDSLALSVTLRPGGVLRGGAVYTAAVQPNQKPALYCLPWDISRRQSSIPSPRAPAARCRSVALPRAIGTMVAVNASTQTQNHNSVKVCGMFTQPAGHRSPNVDLPRSLRSMSIASPSSPWIFTRGWLGSLSSRASWWSAL